MAGRSCPSLDGVLEGLRAAAEAGPVGEILVIGSARAPEGAAVAAAHDVHWLDEAELMSELGPVRGKGDAMWRALSRARGDLVLYCDGDNDAFGPHYVSGLLGPLLAGEASFVKATYERPFAAADGDPAGGGRVTELFARPLLEAFFPEAGELRQPLGGEVAARRELLARIPFMTGYAVEAVMLVDVIAREGLDAVAEVDLGSRANDHQPLSALAVMAREILVGVGSRLEQPPPGIEAIAAELEAAGRVVGERPPLEELATLGGVETGAR